MRIKKGNHFYNLDLVYKYTLFEYESVQDRSVIRYITLNYPSYNKEDRETWISVHESDDNELYHNIKEYLASKNIRYSSKQ